MGWGGLGWGGAGRVWVRLGGEWRVGRDGMGRVANFLFVFDVGVELLIVVEFSLFCLVFISTISIEFPANKKKPNLPITNRLVFSIF